MITGVEIIHTKKQKISLDTKEQSDMWRIRWKMKIAVKTVWNNCVMKKQFREWRNKNKICRFDAVDGIKRDENC